MQLLTDWISVPPTIRIKGTTMLTDGFQFTLPSAWGWTNVIQATTNLLSPTWTALATNSFAANGQTVFTDAAPTDIPARYHCGMIP